MATTSVFAAGPSAYNQIVSKPSSNLYRYNNVQGIDTSGLAGMNTSPFSVDSEGNLIDSRTGDFASQIAVDNFALSEPLASEGGLAGLFGKGMDWFKTNKEALGTIGDLATGVFSAFNTMDQMKSRKLNREAMKEQMERAREDWQATKDYRNSYTPASRRV